MERQHYNRTAQGQLTAIIERLERASILRETAREHLVGVTEPAEPADWDRRREHDGTILGLISRVERLSESMLAAAERFRLEVGDMPRT